MTRLRTLMPPLAGSLAISAILLLWWGDARLLNYDTAYSLLWGSEIAGGHAPAVQAKFAPTQHPLATLLGIVLSLPGLGGAPHGSTAFAIWELIGVLMLGILGWLVFALGRHWFGAATGIVAALIVLTREPVLSFGIRAYIDIPYICLLLAALLVESRRRHAGVPVLVLLALAGLLRPEAWLLTLGYLGWLLYGGALRPVHLACAAAGPGLWALNDLATTGNPIHSFTETRDAAGKLGRVTGITNVPTTMPFRLGEILREPGLLAAAGGGVLALWRLRERSLLLAAAGLLTIVAFTIMATSGMPILTRYLLASGAILAVFAGAAVFGWQRLERDDRGRRPWQAFAVVVVLMFAVFAPKQARLLGNTHRALADQRAILGELQEMSPKAGRGCPATVPNRRPVPQLALWTQRNPDAFRSAQEDRRYTLPAFSPSSPAVAKKFILNKRDTVTFLPAPPRAGSGEQVVRGKWWTLTGRC